MDPQAATMKTPEHPFGVPQEWHNSGSDCCSPLSTCCMSWWCPCFVHGKIQHRVNKDPTLQGYSACNLNCFAYSCVSCFGCGWILQMFGRSEIRRKYNLTGNSCTDCLCACCCAPCDLTQQEKESAFRENERLLANGGAGAPIKVEQIAWQPEKRAEAGMVYQNPQQQQQQHQQYQQYQHQ